MLIPSFYPNRMGGSELQALKLAKQLIANGHEVQVLTIKTPGLSEFENMQGIKVFRMSSRLLLIPRIILSLQTRVPFLQKKVEKGFIKKYGKPNGIAELIISIIFSSLCFKAIRRHSLKFSTIQINTVEWVSVTGALLSKKLSVPLLIKDSTVNGLAKLKVMPYCGKYRRWIIQNSFFVAISSVIKTNLIAEGVNEARIYNISNGIEIQENVPLRNNVIPESCLFVGNLYQEPAKGFKILLQAWQIVIKTFKDAILNVVGDGEIAEYEKLAASMSMRENISFWGKQTNVEDFYLSNEIFVLPSIREGMSNSLMEAMNFGLPCISTKVSGSTDLIIDKESGFLIEPGNAGELAKSIIYLFTHKELHDSIGSKARERVRQLCDFSVISRKYARAYKELKKVG